MATDSKIEWTDATWNVLAGCTPVSSGCANCYAVRDAHRMAGNPNIKVRSANEGLTVVQENGVIGWSKQVRLLPDRLHLPLRWTRPRKIFVNSQSDLFHEDVPFEFIDRVFAVMAMSTQHVFQVLTKRPERMAQYLNERTLPSPTATNLWYRWEHVHARMLDLHCETGKRRGFWSSWPLPNVWLGTSVEDQAAADRRIPHLLMVPAAVRFLSMEPILSDVQLHLGQIETAPVQHLGGAVIVPRRRDLLHWIIAGGESGSNARPASPDWFRSVRDQAAAANVPFFFKQWGEWGRVADIPLDVNLRTDLPEHVFDRAPGSDPPWAPVYRVGKKIAGRLLDGQTWDEFPTVLSRADRGASDSSDTEQKGDRAHDVSPIS